MISKHDTGISVMYIYITIRSIGGAYHSISPQERHVVLRPHIAEKSVHLICVGNHVRLLQFDVVTGHIPPKPGIAIPIAIVARNVLIPSNTDNRPVWVRITDINRTHFASVASFNIIIPCFYAGIDNSVTNLKVSPCYTHHPHHVNPYLVLYRFRKLRLKK